MNFIKKFTLVFFIFTLTGCASGLFIKGNFESSIAQLSSVSHNCTKEILGEDYKVLEGKYFPTKNGFYSADYFSNSQKPSFEEKQILRKLISNKDKCELVVIQWAKDYAPKALNLTLNYSALNLFIYKNLVDGDFTYGQTLTAMRALLLEYVKQLKIMEINVAQNNSIELNNFLKSYLLQSIGADAKASPSNNLIMQCGGRGVNFATGSCF